MEYDSIYQLVIECAREIGEMDEIPQLVEADAKTKLFGPAGQLDSVGLVTLTSDIEQKLYEEHNLSIVLADEKAMSRQVSPFRNIESLTKYIAELVNDHE